MEESLNQLLINYFKQYRLLYSDSLFTDLKPENVEFRIAKASSEITDTQEISLDEYERSIRNCMRCHLGRTRTNFVFGMGSPHADLMFVGEAPGEQEDLQGLPFVGRAGHLLDKILAAISLSRKEVYIANVLKCRPPQNRTPTSEEITLCEPYLHKQIRLIKPKIIVALGRIAAKSLLKVENTLAEMRKKLYSYQGVDLVVTYHPAALLRNPGLKARAWEDFQWIQKLYIEKTT